MFGRKGAKSTRLYFRSSITDAVQTMSNAFSKSARDDGVLSLTTSRERVIASSPELYVGGGACMLRGWRRSKSGGGAEFAGAENAVIVPKFGPGHQSTSQSFLPTTPSLLPQPMIIQQPPDAKLPEHLYSNSNIGHYQNPFASSEDRLTSADNHSYPPPRAPSIADSESPPAYAEQQAQPSASTSALASDSATVVGSNQSKRIKRRRRLRVMAGSILCVYVTSSAILLGLFFVCLFTIPSLVLL